MSSNPFGPPPEIYGYQTLWHSIGNYIARLEQYHRSLPFFDEAVLKCPKDKKTLVDRGKVRGKICFFKGALEDINKAISLDPNDLVSLAERSHAVYLNCEFEDAIVQNYRLLPLRKKPDHFSMGVRKCSTAIQNCLGKSAGNPLRDYFLIIRKLAWLKTFQEGKRVLFVAKNKKVPKAIRKKKPKVRKPDNNIIGNEAELIPIRDSIYSHESDRFVVPPLQQSYNFSPLQRYTTNIENYMAETYLERMYLDKIFVKEVRTRPGINCPNQAGVQKLKTITKDCYKTVYDKQEVLRTRKPFYNIKYQQAKTKGSLKDRQQAELLLLQENTKKDADKIASKLEKQLKERNLTEVVELAEKLKIFCDSKSKRLLPDKQEYLTKITETVCKAFYIMNRLNPDQPKWDQEKRILLCLGQPISSSPSRDSIVQLYQHPLIDLNNQIQVFEHRLEVAENDEETLWYYHELARYYMLVKRYDVAKSYCTRCTMLAEKNEELAWYVNSAVLSMRICIRLLNKNDAILEANRGITAAQMLGDKNLEQYLERCISVITELELDDLSGKKQLEKRQAKILALMQNDKMKSEFAHLFHTMQALPSARRLSIIPGSQKKKERNSSRTTKSFTLDEGSISLAAKGANFVNYVQFHM